MRYTRLKENLSEKKGRSKAHKKKLLDEQEETEGSKELNKAIAEGQENLRYLQNNFFLDVLTYVSGSFSKKPET